MGKTRYGLDTAALLFPVIARRESCDFFRTWAAMDEPVDAELLQQAVDDLAPRFPTFFVSLGHDFSQHYLEEIDGRLLVMPDRGRPLAPMRKRDLKKSCLRVPYGTSHIAADFFHGITDGGGGVVFFLTLVARYLELKHGVAIPAGGFILDLGQAPSLAETEDCFLTCAGEKAAMPRDPLAYIPQGHREPPECLHLTVGVVNTAKLLEAARKRETSVTALSVAAMVQALSDIQRKDTPRRRRKPVLVRVPVNLRGLFGVTTLRNFSLVVNVGVEARATPYRFDELCTTVRRQINEGNTAQYMAATMAAAVRARQNPAFRLAPLFLKSLIIRLLYEFKGERCGSLTISNLGTIRLPEQMSRHVRCAGIFLGPTRIASHGVAIASYGGDTYFYFTRSIREAELEGHFFAHLAEAGLEARVFPCDDLSTEAFAAFPQRPL